MTNHNTIGLWKDNKLHYYKVVFETPTFGHGLSFDDCNILIHDWEIELRLHSKHS